MPVVAPLGSLSIERQRDLITVGGGEGDCRACCGSPLSVQEYSESTSTC